MEEHALILKINNLASKIKKLERTLEQTIKKIEIIERSLRR